MSMVPTTDPYGWIPQAQPTATPTPDHPAGTPEPTARTRPHVTPADRRAPILLIVAMVGAAVLLTQLTVRGSFKVGG